MRKPQRMPLPTAWRSTDCPECGGELKYGAMIFSARSIQGWDKNGALHVGQDYEDFEEAHEDDHLFCTNCVKEWALPKDVTFDDLQRD